MEEVWDLKDLTIHDVSLFLSHRMYSSNGFRNSTPPQNRRLIVSISNNKKYVDSFVRELTFQNHLINTLCEMRVLPRRAQTHEGVGGDDTAPRAAPPPPACRRGGVFRQSRARSVARLLDTSE